MESLIAQFIEYLQFKKYSANSIQNHRLDVLRFQEWLEGHGKSTLYRLKKLTPEDIQAYQDFLEQGVKPRTAARHLSSLRLFFSYLEQQGWVKANPLDLVKFPQIECAPPEILAPEDIVALLEAPPLEHYLGMRDRALLELSYSSGLKVKELVHLNVDDLFLDLGFLKVRGKRERMVPVTSKAVEVLRKYLASARQRRLLNKDDPCLFPNRNGQRMSRIGFWFMVKKHARRAGISANITPKMIRHSFAIHLIQNGMDLPSIRTLFGYATLDATAQYAHVKVPDYEETFHQFHPRGERQSQKDNAQHG